MSNLFTTFSIIRWQDIVDIFLVSYILFRFYVLFKGTNAFRVLIGITFLWFFQKVAVFLGLIVTSWVIQGFTALAAFLLIVIFRYEIRSVLQVKNLRAILWGFQPKGVLTPIEITVDSIYELAVRRIGALIVFPGKEDFTELIHEGIPWRGLISKEMIMSIFWHDNPVHDGAAIIRGNQITEVGVVLPVSHREDLPSHYGTRHRAAIGLSEASDALVIAVSEERGSVSLAKGSEIRDVPQKEELKKILREHTGDSPKTDHFFIGDRFGYVLAALISFIIISGIWFSFTRGIDTLATFEVPLEYMNRDPVMEIIETSVNTVNIDLSGSGPLIKSISPEQLGVRIDLSKAAVGTHSFTLSQEDISIPRGVLLKKIEPSSVEVTLDRPTDKILPVQVDWSGKLSENLTLTAVVIDPQSIKVIGGSQILKSVSTIYTEKVPLDNIEKSGVITVKPVLNPASLKIAPGMKDKITISFTVKERPHEEIAK
ncbi:MAG: DNA integrity scanning protein DisA nucleotide-binding domain protein [Deltaproteobacteria bacterium]|nr:DNA integrity scanning protein DisA nucleotide-binding domain protein [Deltaproteobacteria bacterium]MBW2142281.1 DNA integrity scanning protein DisA nucleotide-binding domain protein [Deltaproteobacteria bacterium]